MKTPHVNPNEEILTTIAVFLKTTAMPESIFGLNALNDPNLVRELNAGRELRQRTRDKIFSFIESYKAQSQNSQRPQSEGAAQ